MRRISLVLLVLITIIFSCTKDPVVQENKIDLFIWAGQSNALGRQGDAADYPSDPNGLDSLIKFNWTHIDNSNSNGWTSMGAQTGLFTNGHFGAEVTFARNLVEAKYKPAIFKYTKGATSIFEHWKGPGENGFYDAMISDLKIAIKDLENLGYTVNIRGFVWIQGESDANSDASANAYENNLKDIINGIRNETNDNSLPIILGVDEQFFNLQNRERPAVLNAHQRLALSDDRIKFTSMYGYPKADLTHLTPAGLIEQGKNIFDTYQILISGKKPTSNCSLTSNGNVISILNKKTWGQSFTTDCSGYLSSITFSAASNLNNSATFTLHNGADCSADILLSQSMNSITNGNNKLLFSNNLYLEKEHTYYINITSDSNTTWKVNYSKTNNVFGNLKTSRNNEDNNSCRWSFLNYDLNFSVEITE